MRRGHERAAGAHLAAGSDGDAVRIDEIDAAGRGKHAIDLRAREAGDAVERGAGAIFEAHAVTGADREAAPIDDGSARALCDHHAGWRGRRDGCLPGRYAATGRQRLSQNRTGSENQCCTGQQRNRAPRKNTFARNVRSSTPHQLRHPRPHATGECRQRPSRSGVGKA